MSVVACKVTNDRIEIVADSISVRGYTQTKGHNKNTAKLNKISDDLIIAHVGLARDGMLMRVFSETTIPAGNKEIDMINYIHDFSLWKKSKTGDGDIDCNYIIIFKGVAWYIEDYLIQRITNYEAIGAGFDSALAALYLGHSAEKAVETACELSVYCEKPIIKFIVELES